MIVCTEVRQRASGEHLVVNIWLLMQKVEHPVTSCNILHPSIAGFPPLSVQLSVQLHASLQGSLRSAEEAGQKSVKTCEHRIE
jgi:hypothetical protein